MLATFKNGLNAHNQAEAPISIYSILCIDYSVWEDPQYLDYL